MSDYSVAEAKNRLSELIDRALAGEAVTITRHGHRVIELKPTARRARAVTEEEIEWLRSVRLGGKPSAEDAGTAVGRMRDEDWR